jgi:hypothetical protein
MGRFWLVILLLAANSANADSTYMHLVCTYTQMSLDNRPRDQAATERVLVSVTYSTKGDATISITDGLQKVTQYQGKVTEEAIAGRFENKTLGEERWFNINRYTGEIISHQYLPEFGTLNAFGTCKQAKDRQF